MAQLKELNIKAIKKNLYKREAEKIKENEKLRQKLFNQVKKLKIWEKYKGIKTAYLFGSCLKEKCFRKTSDIDIFVEGNITQDYFNIWEEIEDNLNWEIDLKELKKENDFTKKVRQQGLKIYERKSVNIKKLNK